MANSQDPGGAFLFHAATRRAFEKLLERLVVSKTIGRDDLEAIRASWNNALIGPAEPDRQGVDMLMDRLGDMADRHAGGTESST